MLHKKGETYLLVGSHHGFGGSEADGVHREWGGGQEPGLAQPLCPPDLRRDVTTSEMLNGWFITLSNLIHINVNHLLT